MYDMREKTPWAVICPRHGQQFLTKDQYNSQLRQADCFWKCPVPKCTEKRAEWDEDNYDSFEELLADEEKENL